MANGVLNVAKGSLNTLLSVPQYESDYDRYKKYMRVMAREEYWLLLARQEIERDCPRLA